MTWVWKEELLLLLGKITVMLLCSVMYVQWWCYWLFDYVHLVIWNCSCCSTLIHWEEEEGDRCCWYRSYEYYPMNYRCSCQAVIFSSVDDDTIWYEGREECRRSEEHLLPICLFPLLLLLFDLGVLSMIRIPVIPCYILFCVCYYWWWRKKPMMTIDDDEMEMSDERLMQCYYRYNSPAVLDMFWNDDTWYYDHCGEVILLSVETYDDDYSMILWEKSIIYWAWYSVDDEGSVDMWKPLLFITIIVFVLILVFYIESTVCWSMLWGRERLIFWASMLFCLFLRHDGRKYLLLFDEENDDIDDGIVEHANYLRYAVFWVPLSVGILGHCCGAIDRCRYRSANVVRYGSVIRVLPVYS